MLKESKRLIVASFLVFCFAFSAYADSAFIPGGYWEQLLQNGGLFGNLTRSGGLFGGNGGTNERLIQTNCQYEERPNPYTGQTTYDLICDNRNVTYNSYPTYTYTQPTYSQPTYYQQPTYYYTQTYSEPVYYYTQTYNQPSYNNSLSYYQGSNIWYPQNNYGYSDSSMFNTYYSGPEGAGRYDRYYDSPNLCFDGGYNCGGYYDGLDGLVYYPNDSREYLYDPYNNYYENIAQTDYYPY